MPRIGSLIAVVDDEESVRKALGRLIGAAGFNVQTFASGADFLRATQSQRPDCVLLDVRMPQMDGFDIQLALTRAHDATPVVIISGDDSTECRNRAFRQGARAYLRKPVDDVTLVDAIQSALLPVSGASA
jgi:FixJ family two-component response regulator